MTKYRRYHEEDGRAEIPAINAAIQNLRQVTSDLLAKLVSLSSKKRDLLVGKAPSDRMPNQAMPGICNSTVYALRHSHIISFTFMPCENFLREHADCFIQGYFKKEHAPRLKGLTLVVESKSYDGDTESFDTINDFLSKAVATDLKVLNWITI